MCGICGVVSRTGQNNEAVVDQMIRRLVHRGPHNQEQQHFGAARLGHTRLSIIDLSPAANQPMVSETGRLAITYNGEIYNFPELRADLVRLGVRFRTRSDTEVLLAGFETWGADVFPRLNGIFSLGLWETDIERLHLVRDRFGVKPLYYARAGADFFFSSELSSLRAGLGSCSLSAQGLSEYLWFGSPLTPLTLFENVFQVPSGHHLVLDADGPPRIAPYLTPPAGGDLDVGVEEAARTVRDLLERAVARQLISDVPVGVFLSGGIDSSAIALFAARHSSEQLSSYFVQFDFLSGRDERAIAKRVADLAGTRHEELYVQAPGLQDTIVALLRAHGQPFGDPADIPLYLLCKQLGGETRVVLQGDGGDELFAGYQKHALYRYRPLWRLLNRARGLNAVAMGSRGRAVVRLADACNGDRAREIGLLMTPSTAREPATQVLSEACRQRVDGGDPFRRFRELWPAVADADPVQQMLHLDTLVLLPDYFFQKVDRATMAWGVEVRVPFLDNDLAAYALSLPSSFKQRGRRSKWILKRALEGVVPDWVLKQPKQGFGVPYENWLRGALRPWLLEVLHDPMVVNSGILDLDTIGRLLEEDASGKRYHAPLLWKVFLLALWLVDEGSSA
jgi:asparagine synthase (glutamine-hydrolysing)